MLRTFVYVGLGHTMIRLPGASEKTEVPEGGEIQVDDAHPAFKALEKILKANQFKESRNPENTGYGPEVVEADTSVSDLSTPENGAALKAAKKSRAKKS